MTDTVTINDLQQKLDKALSSIERLEKKNSELIDREKKAKTDAENAADEAQRIADEAASKAGDVEGIKAAHSREIKKLQDSLDARDRTLNTMLIDNAIATKIGEAGVFPHFSKAVTAMIKADAVVKNGEATVGDVPLGDYISSFLTSDEGKHFVAAPQNGGAGAIGSTAKSSEWSKAPATAVEMTAWANYATANPASASSLTDQWGMPHLKP